MNIRFTLFFCASLLTTSFSTFSQNWLKSIGGSSTDVAYTVAIDGNKNVYLGGAFSGTAVNFNPGGTATNITTALSGDNGFIAKYSSGGVLQWAIPYYRGSGGTRVNSIETDASNNVYVTGWYDGANVDFNPLGTAVIVNSTGSQDIFLAKYSSAGILQWVRLMGGSTYADQGNGLAIDPTDEGIVLTGSFIAVTNFNPAGAAMTLTPAGGATAGNADLFIAKYNSSGICQWIRQVGSSPNSEVGNSVVCDATGNIYIGGWFWSTGVNFNPGGVAVNKASGSSGSDLFLAKYNNSGILQWIVNGGGSGADNVNGVALDASGNVYATGSFNGTTNFNPLGVTSNLVASGTDAFVSKYDGSGILQWAKGAGGSSSDRGRCIAVADDNTVLVGGQFSGSNIDFNVGGGSALPLTAAGSSDGFMLAYTSAGAAIYGMAIGGTSSDDVKGITIDNNDGKFISTGQYNGSNINFDALNSTGSFQTSSSTDIFVGRYLMSNGHLNISTLPVSWTSIAAERNGDKVLLKWETACEINNTGFTVERSTDGRNFRYAGYMPSIAAPDCGKGSYAFEDGVKGIEGKIYYRLKQTDIDGKHTYSKTVVVADDGGEKISVQVSPNPARNNFSITSYGNNKPEKAIIYNTSGKLMKRITLGSYNNVDCSGYAPGMYYINYYKGDKLVQSDKIVISR